MSLRYSFIVSEDGSYKFTTDSGHHYLIYFSESYLPDLEGNSHTLYNIGFSRNGNHSNNSFIDKYDGKIRNTITFILNDLLIKNEHQVLIYFCFGDDGYARHRKITFNTWSKYLVSDVEKHDSVIRYENANIYGSLLIMKDNPLKRLILNAFEDYLAELQDK